MGVIHHLEPDIRDKMFDKFSPLEDKELEDKHKLIKDRRQQLDRAVDEMRKKGAII